MSGRFVSGVSAKIALYKYSSFSFPFYNTMVSLCILLATSLTVSYVSLLQQLKSDDNKVLHMSI